MGLWEVLIVISPVYGQPASLASILSLWFLILRPHPIGLDSNCELHYDWLKRYPSLLPASYLPLPKDNAPLLFLAPHNGK